MKPLVTISPENSCRRAHTGGSDRSYSGRASPPRPFCFNVQSLTGVLHVHPGGARCNNGPPTAAPGVLNALCNRKGDPCRERAPPRPRSESEPTWVGGSSSRA